MKTLKTADTPATTPASEDSCAFSLDALRAREAASIRARSPGASESGVIDLDAVRMAGPGPLPGLAAPATRLLTPETTPATSATTPRWAIGTLAVLGGAVAALGAVVALGLPYGTAATQDPAPPPTMAAAAVLDVADDMLVGGGGLEIEGAIIPDAAAPPPAPAPAVTAEPEPASTAEPKAKSTRKRSTTTTRAKTTKPTAPKPKPKATTPAPKAKTSSEPSVACILDPASCGLGSAPKAKPRAKTPATSLPEKLSSTQIRTALAGPKAKAKQCRDMHAAAAGTKVSVKLSIGGSGTVLSATPQSPPSAALGRCVADALATAEFPRFSKTAMGVVYSVRL